MDKKGYAVCLFVVRTDAIDLNDWNNHKSDDVILLYNQAVLHDKREDAEALYHVTLSNMKGK